MKQNNMIIAGVVAVSALIILVVMLSGTVTFNVPIVPEEEEIVIYNNNSDLQKRLSQEIEANQDMATMIQDVLIACNEKLLDKYDRSMEKLEKENEILQKALSKFRQT